MKERLLLSWSLQPRMSRQQALLLVLAAMTTASCASWPAPMHVTTPADVHARPYNDRGIALAGKCQYEQAVSEFNKAVELSPVYAAAYYNRGMAYLSLGQYDRAIFDFNRVIELGNDVDRASSATVRRAAYVPKEQYARTYYNRGVAYLYKAQYELAIADFTNVLEINPASAQAYNNRGAAYTEKAEYEQAMSDLNKALKLNPRYALAYMNRGLVYFRKGDDEMAISDYTRSLEIDAGLALAYANRGRAYGRSGQFDQALSDLNRALEINPGAAEAYDGLARVHAVQGKYGEAESLFKKALAIFEMRFGPEHLYVAESLEGYAAVLRKMRREAEAGEAEARAKAIRTKQAR
jgi:tetratricopeptide (TPR) repeat protein